MGWSKVIFHPVVKAAAFTVRFRVREIARSFGNSLSLILSFLLRCYILDLGFADAPLGVWPQYSAKWLHYTVDSAILLASFLWAAWGPLFFISSKG